MSFHESERPWKRQRTAFPQLDAQSPDSREQSPYEEDTPEEDDRLEADQWASQRRFRHCMEDIFQRYSADTANEADEINLRTGAILINRGHLAALPDAEIDDDCDSFTSDEDGVVDDHDEDILDFLQTPAKAAPNWFEEDAPSTRSDTSSLWKPGDNETPLRSLEINEMPSEGTILRQFGPAGPAVLEFLKKQAATKATSQPPTVDMLVPDTTNNGLGDDDDLTLLTPTSVSIQTPLKLLSVLNPDAWGQSSSRSPLAARSSSLMDSSTAVRPLEKYLMATSCSSRSSKSISRKHTHANRIDRQMLGRLRPAARTLPNKLHRNLKLAKRRIAESRPSLLDSGTSDSLSEEEAITFKSRDDVTDDELRSPERIVSSEVLVMQENLSMPTITLNDAMLIETSRLSSHGQSQVPAVLRRNLGPTIDPGGRYKCSNEDCTSLFTTPRNVTRHLKRGTCDTRPYSFKCTNEGCQNAYRTKHGRDSHVADYCTFQRSRPRSPFSASVKVGQVSPKTNISQDELSTRHSDEDLPYAYFDPTATKIGHIHGLTLNHVPISQPAQDLVDAQKCQPIACAGSTLAFETEEEEEDADEHHDRPKGYRSICAWKKKPSFEAQAVH